MSEPIECIPTTRPATALSGTFAVGDRVVVREANGYDNPVSEHFGPMAGHYGHVVKVNERELADRCEDMVCVNIEGNTRGPVSPGVIAAPLWSQLPHHWWFYPVELEHAD